MQHRQLVEAVIALPLVLHMLVLPAAAVAATERLAEKIERPVVLARTRTCLHLQIHRRVAVVEVY